MSAYSPSRKGSSAGSPIGSRGASLYSLCSTATSRRRLAPFCAKNCKSRARSSSSTAWCSGTSTMSTSAASACRRTRCRSRSSPWCSARIRARPGAASACIIIRMIMTTPTITRIITIIAAIEVRRKSRHRRERTLAHRGEQILHQDPTSGKSLFVQIAAQRVDSFSILFDPVWPNVRSENGLRRAIFGFHPGQGDGEGGKAFEVGERGLLCPEEGVVNCLGHVRIFLHEIVADSDSVHHRIDACRPVVGLL